MKNWCDFVEIKRNRPRKDTKSIPILHCCGQNVDKNTNKKPR